MLDNFGLSSAGFSTFNFFEKFFEEYTISQNSLDTDHNQIFVQWSSGDDTSRQRVINAYDECKKSNITTQI